MPQKQNQQSRQKPPRFLDGIFIAILVVIALILSSSWLIINHQLDTNISSRTSEYAHSIAKIAANLSAEALLSEDQLQLQMLVDNVAKDPYVKQASIYAENGQIVAESNPDTTNEVLYVSDAIDDAPDSLNQKLAQPLLADLQNQPFVESIIYQDVTHGWFKLVIDKTSLEHQFIHSLNFSKNIILLISALLLIALLIVMLQLTRPIKQINQYCQRLIQLNTDTQPKDKQAWLKTLFELSQTQFIQPESTEKTSSTSYWTSSKRHPNSLFCYCQFSMQVQENENTAQSLALAESYLIEATKAYGVSVQGNILSGCLIPFFDSDINDALCFAQLLKSLLSSIELPVEMRAFIGSGAILALYNERGESKGFSLSNRLSQKINNITPYTQSDDTIFINFSLPQLQKLGEFKALKNPLQIQALQLSCADKNIIQQISRQLSYIKQNNHN